MKRNYMDIFDEFAENEVLFEHWWNFLCYERKIFGETDFMELWAKAKDTAINVLGSKKALLKFRREIDLLRSRFTYTFHSYSLGLDEKSFDVTFCCATTMIIISGKKDEVDGIRNEFAQVYHSQANEIATYAADLIYRIEAGMIKKDYDYSKVDGGLKDCEDSNSEDVICVDSKIRQTEKDDNKKTIEELEQTIKEQKEKISELEKQLAAYEAGPIEEEPHNKVRLELVRQLFNSAGADYSLPDGGIKDETITQTDETKTGTDETITKTKTKTETETEEESVDVILQNYNSFNNVDFISATQKAVDKGWVKIKDGKYKWVGPKIYKGNSDSVLTYFIGKALNLKTDVEKVKDPATGKMKEQLTYDSRQDAINRFPKEEINSLFGKSLIISQWKQIFTVQKKQVWREVIDKFFDENKENKENNIQ